MNRKSNIFTSMLAVAVLLTLSGCASKSTIANEMFGSKSDINLTGSGLAVNGNEIFATSGNSSYSKNKALYQITVADGNKLQIKDVIPLENGFPQAIGVKNESVYIADGQRIYKFSKKGGKLQLINELIISNDPVFGPQDIAVGNNYIFVAARRGGVMVINEDFEIVAVLKSDFARGVDFSGDSLLLSDEGSGVVEFIKGSDWFGLRSSYRKFSEGEMDSGTAHKSVKYGDYILVAAGSTPLQIFKRDDATGELIKVSEIKTVPGAQFYGTNSYDIAVKDDIAFLAGGESAVIAVSLKDIDNPKIIGESKELFYRGIKAVEFYNDYLLVNDDGNELLLLDVSNPEKMKVVSSVTLSVPHDDK